MRLTIKNAEQTNSEQSVNLELSNGASLIVGNGVVNKRLKADGIPPDYFIALASAGGYAVAFDGRLVPHNKGETYGEDGMEYRSDGFHIVAEEDVFPSIVQTPKFFELKVQLPTNLKTQLLGEFEEELKTQAPEPTVETETAEPEVTTE